MHSLVEATAPTTAVFGAPGASAAEAARSMGTSAPERQKGPKEGVELFELI